MFSADLIFCCFTFKKTRNWSFKYFGSYGVIAVKIFKHIQGYLIIFRDTDAYVATLTGALKGTGFTYPF